MTICNAIAEALGFNPVPLKNILDGNVGDDGIMAFHNRRDAEFVITTASHDVFIFTRVTYSRFGIWPRLSVRIQRRDNLMTTHDTDNKDYQHGMFKNILADVFGKELVCVNDDMKQDEIDVYLSHYDCESSLSIYTATHHIKFIAGIDISGTGINPMTTVTITRYSDDTVIYEEV